MHQKARLLQAGHQALEEGKFATAVAKLREALSLDEEDSTIRLLLAEAMAEDGKVRAALTVLDATPATVNDLDLLLLKGDLLLEENDLDGAKKAYRHVVEQWPESEDGWVSLGLVESMQHDYNAALAAYEKALELDPQSVFALNARGDAYYATGEVETAQACYQAALEVDADDVQALHRLGEIFFDRQSYDEAERLFLQAQERDPEYESVYLSLGYLYLKTEKTKRSVDAFETFLSLETNPAAKEVREEVKAVIEGLKGT